MHCGMRVWVAVRAWRFTRASGVRTYTRTAIPAECAMYRGYVCATARANRFRQIALPFKQQLFDGVQCRTAD